MAHCDASWSRSDPSHQLSALPAGADLGLGYSAVGQHWAAVRRMICPFLKDSHVQFDAKNLFPLWQPESGAAITLTL
jgi:hypothetical protein